MQRSKLNYERSSVRLLGTFSHLVQVQLRFECNLSNMQISFTLGIYIVVFLC